MWALNPTADLEAACTVCPCQTQRGLVACWRKHTAYFLGALCLAIVLRVFILKRNATDLLKKEMLT